MKSLWEWFFFTVSGAVLASWPVSWAKSVVNTFVAQHEEYVIDEKEEYVLTGESMKCFGDS